LYQAPGITSIEFLGASIAKSSSHKKLYVTDVCLADDTAYVIAHPVDRAGTNTDRTFLFAVQNDQASLLCEFEMEITGIGSVGKTLFAIDGSSNVLCFEAGKWKEFSDVGDSVPRISAVRVLGKDLYGLTSAGVICLWAGSKWKELTPNDDETYIFDLAIDGKGKMIATGDNGFAAYVVKGKFQRLKLPTSQSLTSVLVLADDKLLLTGWEATALIGNAGKFTSLKTNGRDETFSNSVTWNGKILIAAKTEILELKGTVLSTFAKTPAARLVSHQEHLWKIYDSGVARFEKGRWIGIALKV
jgi:hypothetical protein